MSPIRLVVAWRAAGRQAELRLAERARRLGRRGVLVPVLAAALCALLFAWWAPRGLANGDAAVYAEQIEQRAFGERSVHIGYTVVSAVLLGFPERVVDHRLNLLTALFAALTVGLIARIALVTTGRSAAAVGAALALAGSWTFVRQATTAEVYAPQVFFLVLAAWAWLRGRAGLSGVALAVSVLHTPSSLFAVPAFLLIRPDIRRIAWLGGVGGGLTLAVLTFVWQDYFHGPRGLLAATSGGLGLGGAVVKEGVEVVFGVFALAPFALLGGWRLIRRRQWPVLAALALAWAVTFGLGERFADVPVQLPTWTALALISAVGGLELLALLRRPGASRRLWIGAVGLVALGPLGALVLVRGRSSVLAQVSDDRILVMATIVVVATGLALAVAGRTARGARVATAVVFGGAAAAGLLLAATLATAEQTQIDTYREQSLAVAPLFGPDAPPALAVAGWSRAVLFERYVLGEVYSGPVVNAEWWHDGGGDQGQRARQLRDGAVAAGAPVWLLGDHPGPQADLESQGYRFEAATGGFLYGVRSSAAPPASSDSASHSTAHSTEDSP